VPSLAVRKATVAEDRFGAASCHSSRVHRQALIGSCQTLAVEKPGLLGVTLPASGP
jgi:hypothetical protein